jgi:rare lipoprotein A
VKSGAVAVLALTAIALVSAGCGGEASAASKEPVRSAASTSTEAQPTAPEGGPVERGEASYYAQSLAGRPTASGEPYKPAELTAAHKTLPFGTLIEVRRQDGRRVVVRVNDRGPFRKGRVVDLSRRAAEQLGMIREGVVKVEVRVVKAAPPKKPKPRSRQSSPKRTNSLG